MLPEANCDFFHKLLDVAYCLSYNHYKVFKKN